MSRNSLYRSEIDFAILKALKDSRQPLRYNKLHVEASNVFGSRIWIKTFNDHLKKLCKKSEVIRNEKSRYKVTYEPAKKHTDKVHKVIELEKEILDYAFHHFAQIQDPELRARIIKKWIKDLARWRVYSVLQIISDAVFALVEGEEKEAQRIVDEFAYAYRIILDHIVKTSSKINGIKPILKEMKEEEEQAMEKRLQELEKISPIRLLRRFKSTERQDWKWQEWGDVVKVDDKYHSFLVMTSPDYISDSSFMRISKRRRCLYEDETGEHYITVSYQAWFLGTSSERVPNFVRFLANEKLSKTNSIYCLAPRQSACFVYNNTDSVVFKQFERFLENAGFRLEPFSKA